MKSKSKNKTMNKIENIYSKCEQAIKTQQQQKWVNSSKRKEVKKQKIN